MTKLTTEITIEELQYRIHAHENDLTQMWTADYFLNVQKELLASKQSAKNSADLKTLVISEIVDFYAGFESPGEPETVDEAQSQLIERIEKVFGLTAPVLPKQSELVENLKKVMNNWLAMEPKLAFQPEFTDVMMLLDAEAAPAQPVSEPYKLPSGWKLVPIEPTSKMIVAAMGMLTAEELAEVWGDMIEAAPAQESE